MLIRAQVEIFIKKWQRLSVRCSIESALKVKNGRTVLVDYLRRLMRAKGWVRPHSNTLDISKLHAKLIAGKPPDAEGSKGSRRWLYKLLRGETSFGIDKYDEILLRGFGLHFDSLLAGASPADVPEDVEDLYEALKDAIDCARQTRTLDALRYGVYALRDKCAGDLALITNDDNSNTHGPREGAVQATAGIEPGDKRVRKRTG